MIYITKPFEVCRQGLNIHRWNHMVLLVGKRAFMFSCGHFRTFRGVQ
jgi:hypothetical protein